MIFACCIHKEEERCKSLLNLKSKNKKNTW